MPRSKTPEGIRSLMAQKKTRVLEGLGLVYSVYQITTIPDKPLGPGPWVDSQEPTSPARPRRGSRRSVWDPRTCRSCAASIGCGAVVDWFLTYVFLQLQVIACSPLQSSLEKLNSVDTGDS